MIKNYSIFITFKKKLWLVVLFKSFTEVFTFIHLYLIARCYIPATNRYIIIIIIALCMQENA